jgi:pimeloyl-ACP methyl ester carboxylesterase
MKEWARNIFYFLLRNKDYVKANGVMRETIKKALNEDLLPDLPKIKVKTLIVWGKEDKLLPVQCAYVFKEKIAGSQLEIMPKVGHSPHLEAPEKLAQIIVSFLKS